MLVLCYTDLSSHVVYISSFFIFLFGVIMSKDFNTSQFTVEQALSYLVTNNHYGRPAGFGTSMSSSWWDTLYPYFDFSNRQFAKQNGLAKYHVQDSIKDGMPHYAHFTKGSGFMKDMIVNPSSPCYMEIKNMSKEKPLNKDQKNKKKVVLFNGNDSFVYTEGLYQTCHDVMISLQNKNDLIAITHHTYNQHGVAYKVSVVNVSEMIKNMCHFVDTHDRVVVVDEEEQVKTFHPRFVVTGSNPHGHDYSLAFLYQKKNKKGEGLYWRLRVKLSSIQKWISLSHQHKQVDEYLTENGYMASCTIGVKTDKGFFYKKDAFSELKKAIEHVQV